MKKISLAGGLFALVDDEDFFSLSKTKWQVHRDGRCIYAKRVAERNGVRKKISMHGQIMRPEPGMVVDHLNYNGLDNRRCNLRVCSIAENTRRRPGANKNSRLGLLGVSQRADKFIARIQVNGRVVTLGVFITPDLAAAAYRNYIGGVR